MKISPSKVRSARERAMLSQDEVAELVGASDFSVWRWEHGEEPVGIRPKAARKLHDALGVQLGELTPDDEGIGPLDAAMPLQLEEMYVADAAARRRALEGAAPRERAAYASTIDRVVLDVMRGIPEWEGIADDVSKTESERRVARESREALWRHINRLTALRAEATGEAEEPPQEELAEFIAAHAGVGAA